MPNNAGIKPLVSSVSFGPDRYDEFSPTVIPHQPQSFTTLNSFSVTAGTGNSGTFTFQVSTDAGVSWYYYDGSLWRVITLGVSESSTAASINSHISTLPVGTKAFLFKAFLTTTNSSQQAVLGSVSLDFIP